MTWKKADLYRRIEARADALGMNVVSALPPGYETFFSPSKADQSPTIATLEKISATLGWSLCDLLCDDHPAVRHDLLDMAIAEAIRALWGRPELLSAAITSTYDVLAMRERDGLPNDATVLSALTGLLKYQNKMR